VSTDERATLTNMTAELGGFRCIVAPDRETVRFLQERRCVHCELEPWMCNDAVYANVIRLDCATLSPCVAAPGDPGNGIALNHLERLVNVDIAYGGSCTAGRREDFDRYHEVLAGASATGAT
jgi:3-isopropylmalate/(R)-2-methylmalate dehydratase large subunit